MSCKKISKVDLTRIIKDAGFVDIFIETDINNENKVAAGNINFETLPCGIDIHSADIVESINGSSTSEVSACLSVNILLEGQVCFALEDKYFDIKIDDKPIIFINVLSGKQLFTRFFCEGRHVKKLNISVSKSWLINRCTSVKDQQFIQRLFKEQQAVYQWPAHESIVELASNLFVNNSNKNNGFIWSLEQQAFQLFSKTFELLTTICQTKSDEVKGQTHLIDSGHGHYEKKIDGMLDKIYSLEQVAKNLGASVSTLQRYFKTHHQLTLKAYIRNQKLELARRTLIFDHKTIGEVAYLAGYNHTSNFTTAFKKYFSIAPTDFQHQYNATKNTNQ